MSSARATSRPATTSPAVTCHRFDYESVALLPDGKIAVSFVDSSCLQPTLRDPNHDSPEVAILI